MLTFIQVKDRFDHYWILNRWLQQKAVLEFYEGLDQHFTYQRVKDKFQPKTKSLDLTPLFIVFNHKKIGYLQYYWLSSAEKRQLDYPLNLKILGFDLFLSQKYQNQGLGQKTILTLIADLKIKQISYDKLIVDPVVENQRAIKCYQACNFSPTKLVKNYEVLNQKPHDVLILELNSQR